MFEEIQNFTPQNQMGAKCSFCKQHARDMEEGRRARTFRTPTYIHMEGWIEVCEKCIVEMAVKVGMIPTAEAEELEGLLVASQERADSLLADLEDARASVRVLSASVARDAEDSASKAKAAYDRGYEQAKADAKLEHADA
jgi:hypothetical protein